MGKEKKRVKSIEIPMSFYYDGRKKKWKEENIVGTINRPSIDEINDSIGKWNKTNEYIQSENVLKRLFLQLCPNNSEISDVLIKVCTLDKLYNTSIYKTHDVARIIVDMKIDDRLSKNSCDVDLVDEMVSHMKSITGSGLYSFVTKYCSHHKPNLYPIYDTYVGILLRYYRDNYGENVFSFSDEELKSYKKFCEIMREFKTYFGLNADLKGIDIFLWQKGKECFPRWKKQRINENNDSEKSKG